MWSFMQLDFRSEHLRSNKIRINLRKDLLHTLFLSCVSVRIIAHHFPTCCVCKSHPSSCAHKLACVWNSSAIKHKYTLRGISIPITIIIMKQQRQPNNSSSSSRVATVLLLTIALPYLLFSRCSADESSSLIIDRRATGLKKKQLQRHLKKLDQKRIRQSTLSTLLELEPDAPVTDGFAIAAASAGAKSSKAAPPPLTPRTAPPVAPPTYPPTVSIQPTSKPSLSPSVSTQPSAKPSLAPSVSSEPSSKPSLAPSLSSQPSSKPSLSPSVSSQPSFAPSKSGKSSPRSRRYD